jgi:ADP-ribose pyrophosphatase
MTTTTKIRGGWEILDDRGVDDFGIFKTRKSRRRNLRNGSEFEFFLMEGLDWANIVALTSNNEVVLTRQYRHGYEREILELPGGCIELGEDPAAAAAREFEEETGFIARDLRLIGKLIPNPALMSMNLYSYFTRNIVPNGKTNLDDGENIEVILMPLDEVYRMIERQELNHALHVAVFGLLALRKNDFLP